MEIKVRDENTLVIEPQDASEMFFLQRFEGGKITIEKPQPMQPNIVRLKIEVKEEKTDESPRK